MIEVELRGFLTKTQYNSLLRFLKKNGANCEDDSKVAHYFKYSNGILKVVDEKSKARYKISLKEGDEHAGYGLKESEIYLSSQSDHLQALEMLKLLGFTVKSVVDQQRVNINYKSVEFALKYTDSWGYHFEAEILVKSPGEIEQARQHILAVCKELDITPLSEKELRSFVQSLERK